MVNDSGYPCLVPHLRGKAFPFSLLTMMIAAAGSYRVFNCVKACFFCTHFLRIFIINGCWILLNAFPAPIEVIVWLLSFILIMWCIKLIDLQTLKHLCISGINPTWSYSIVVQSLSHVWLFATPWTAACQASWSFTISRSLLKLMSIEVGRTSNYPVLCCPLLLLPSIFPSIRVFSNELALLIRWPKYCSLSFSISPSMNVQDWFPLGLTGLISLQYKGLWRVYSNTTVQKHQFFGAQPSLWFNSHIHTWLLEKP